MSGRYVLWAWPLSLYSGKARAYLRYKGIPHVEKPIRAWHMGLIKRRTGASVMPVVVTPEGEWLQDTSYIMDRLEERFPQAPVLPATPRQRLAALLLEAWGDEFWLPAAMHYRWNFPENFTQLFQPEGGDLLAPLAPRFVKNRLIATGAARMRSFLPILGVTPAQARAIEAWTEGMCDALDAHFARMPYLFGTRPSYADFGLIGPLYAHLGRDPYPRRVLVAPRRHLRDWVARMQEPPQPRAGEFLPGDEVAATLAPLLRSVFAEFWPALERTQEEVSRALPTLRPGRGFARALGEIEFPLGEFRFRRRAAPFSLWMAQRALDAYAALDGAARAGVDAWLAGVGGQGAMQLSIRPRLVRMGLHVAPEGAAHGRDPAPPP
jgi:glutathione S-transferase